MLLKRIALIASLLLAGCAAPKPPPVTPPPPVTVVPAKPAEVKPVAVTVLSTTVKLYKGPTWSVSFPDNMTVLETDDDQIKVIAEDKSVFEFVSQAGNDDLESFTTGVVAQFMQLGHRPAMVRMRKISGFDANIVIFESDHGVVALALMATGTHTYGLLYGGVDNDARLQAFIAAMDSIVVTDKPVVKPLAKPAHK